MIRTVLFHTHGIGEFEFSGISARDLAPIDELLARRSSLLCATAFLTQANFAAFSEMLMAFSDLKSAGQLHNLLGFAIEGPMLGSRGGTPPGAVWRPTRAQWQEITRWLSLGLKYIVLAPDVVALDEEVAPGLTFGELLTQIYESGGRVALGHFRGEAAAESAARVNDVLVHIESRFESSPYLVLTDHLFNDMPRSFRHAFRTPSERVARHAELSKLRGRWTPASLPPLLGPVPAALLIAAREERLTPSLNFDGGHVDLAICNLVVEYLGSSRLIAMTDHVEVDSLAGEALSKDGTTGLLYRPDGVLAASSVAQEKQRQNMTAVGITDLEINNLFNETPLAALNYVPCKRPHRAAQV